MDTAQVDVKKSLTDHIHNKFTLKVQAPAGGLFFFEPFPSMNSVVEYLYQASSDQPRELYVALMPLDMDKAYTIQQAWRAGHDEALRVLSWYRTLQYDASISNVLDVIYLHQKDVLTLEPKFLISRQFYLPSDT